MKAFHRHKPGFRTGIGNVESSRELILLSLCFSGSVYVVVVQSRLTLCNPMDCSPPGSSVHRILQARILECIAMPFSKDLPDPGIEPRSPELQVDPLSSWPQGKLSLAVQAANV